LIDRELADRTNIRSCLDTKKITAEHILFLKQIHGAEVVTVDAKEKIYGEELLPRADALITNLKNVAIAVVTADCGPLLFFDKEKKIIAAAHAGWRGARLGVIGSTMAAMKKLGAENIQVVIGPMIQQKSYEVSQEFFDEFLGENKDNEEFFINGAGPGKYWFDLPGYIEKKLRAAGVEKIRNVKRDTYSNEGEFFSFRRSTHRGDKGCGHNISVIVVE
jgi:YfiH family protein